MANSDASIYTLRYNEISGALEAASSINWLAVALHNNVTGTVTGHASLDLPLTGGTLTGGLTITTTSAALIPPKMTNTQRDALTPVEGMMIYSTTDHLIEFYDGTTWQQVATV